MRRTDREMTDISEICRLLDKCDTLRVGFRDESAPYIVPLSFGYGFCDGAFVFYVHGAKDGRRHRLAEMCPQVCVEADMCLGFAELGSGALTADYKSFIGTGEISTVCGEEAVKGLELICRHCGFDKMDCSEAVVKNTCVEKIVVTEFSAKQRFK